MSLTHEVSLVTKLKALQVPCNPFSDGLTTFEQRRELVRGAVSQVPDVVFTIRDGKVISMAQQFRAVYRCEL